jgi:hypothetical protein
MSGFIEGEQLNLHSMTHDVEDPGADALTWIDNDERCW